MIPSPSSSSHLLKVLTRTLDGESERGCAWLLSQTAWQNIWKEILMMMMMMMMMTIRWWLWWWWIIRLKLTSGFAVREFPFHGSQSWDLRPGNLHITSHIIQSETGDIWNIQKILTNILPLFGHSLEQWSVRLEQGPEFEQLCFMTQVCVIKTFRPES